MNRINSLWALVLMLMSLSAFAGDEWVFTDPPVVQNPDGSVIRNPAASIRGDWKHQKVLQGVSTSLPEKLPGMGSRMEMLNYIVASNGFSMNVYVGLICQTPSLELSTGRWADGFGSYDEFLADVRTGMSFVLERFKTNQLPANAKVYANVYVSYFHDGSTEDQRGNGIGLLIVNEIGAFKTLSIDGIMNAVAPDRPISIAQTIVKITQLRKIDITVDIGSGVTASMSWTKSTGAILSSTWRTYSPREWSTPTYLYIREFFADGSKPSRISLTSEGGEDATYTETGDRVLEPQLTISGRNLVITGARSSLVGLQVSSNLLDWVEFSTTRIPINTNIVAVPLQNFGHKQQFFRGTSW